MYILIGNPQSPWTVKARWALEVCRVPHVFKHYLPPLHEPLLRLRTRRFREPISVPVLLERSATVWGATPIAELANRWAFTQSGALPLGDLSAAAPWLALSDQASSEGRARVTAAYLGNADALVEAMPPLIPRVLRRPLRFMARDACARIADKYAHLVAAGAMRNALELTRARLAQVGGSYLLGSLSYADLAMAAVLEMVCPRVVTSPRYGAATRQVWSDPGLSQEYADLLAWRARLVSTTQPSFMAC